jgi:hypothetical protein
MNWRPSVMTPILLALSSAAYAQGHGRQPAHQNTAPHQGGAAQPAHAPQQHPAMHEQQMWNQWYHEQMMLNEMMSAPRTRRGRPQASPGASQNTQVAPSGRQPATSRRSAASEQQLSQPNRTASPATHGARKPGANESESAKKTKHEAHAAHESRARIAKNASKNRITSDQSVISLLRTTHARLARADHDYAGHRVKAMNHIASALQDLGSIGVGNSAFPASSGNLAQSRSDEMLRDAMLQLKITENSLLTGNDRAERHHRARGAVAHAIRELETALQVR